MTPRPLQYVAASGLVLVAVAGVLCVQLAGILIKGDDLDPWSQALVHAIGFGAAIWLGLQGAGDAPARETLAVRRFPPGLLLALVPLAIGLSVLLSELDNWVLEGFPVSAEELAASIVDPAKVGVGTLAHVILVAPILEELFFRGVLQERLSAGYGTGPAVVFTAGAFALAHMGTTPTRFLPEIVVAGLVLGWIAAKTRSTIATATVHVLHNAAPLVVSARVLSVPGWNSVTSTGAGAHVRPAFVALAAGLAALGVFAVARAFAAGGGMSAPSPARLGRVALCLCGGGVTGAMYEVGCLVALEDGLPGFDAGRFDLYVGTSGGASVAAILAGGIPVKRLYRALLNPDDDFFPLQRRDVLSFDSVEWRRALYAVVQTGRRIGASYLSRPRDVDLWQELDRFYDSLPAGIFTMDAYQAFLEDFFRRRGIPDRFPAFARPLFIPANDLDTGHRVVFGQGPLQDASVSAAICASSALPIFFAPVRIGDADYVDGGIGKVAHIDIPVRWGADLVFVINPVVPIRTDAAEGIPTGHGRGKRIRNQGMLGVYNQAFRMSVRTRIQMGLKRFQAQNPGVEVVILEPNEREATMFLYSPMNFAARRTILRYGYASTLEYLEKHGPALQEALARRGFGGDRGSIPPPP